ncbi:hypothetical protein [Oscillatoria sp. HE19RPO]|nr:hypothetical protein [Oscillatoria sp. HE19RPO]
MKFERMPGRSPVKPHQYHNGTKMGKRTIPNPLSPISPVGPSKKSA